jgi:allophanate hydrolase subunit 2
VAVVGGSAEPTIDGRPARAGAVLPVVAGQTVSVGLSGTSLRAVLAVAGGVAGRTVFGSCSTDTLSWTGPGPLRRGEVLHLGPRRAPLGGHLSTPFDLVTPPSEYALRVLPGPHRKSFAPDALDRLAQSTFTVDPLSDRVGVRLTPADGSPALGRCEGELVSEPTVTGAVQVPPSGAPVVLGVDHATLGGYPVVAVVIAADISLLGRCRVGDRVRLVPVDAATARAARLELRRHLDAAVVGHFPTASGT